MSKEIPVARELKPKQTVFDRVINALRDPRLPQKTRLILASLLIAGSVAASRGTIPLSPTPSEASFSPSTVPALAETASPTPTQTLESTPKTTPTTSPTVETTPGATPPASKTNPEAPGNYIETAQMKAELIVINIYRRDRGLPELTYSEKLGEIANYKAQDLSITWPKLPPKGDPHIDSKGRGVGLRDQEMGLTDWLVAGENVEVNNYTDSDINKEAQSVIDAWDASPEHKAIMVGEWDYAAFGNYKDLNNGREFAVLEVEKSVNYKPAPKSTPTKSTSPSNSPAPSSEPSPTIVPTEKPTPAPTPEPTLAPSVSPAVLIFPRRKPIKNYGRKLPKAA